MGVGDEEQMKNKQEEAPRTTMVLDPLAPVCLCYKPVLKALPRPVALASAKGDPLAPVGNTNRF